jgi:cation transport ATPase
MALDPLFQWLYATAAGEVIRENESLFPWLEAIHVLAITLVVGSIAIVDLRLIGVSSLDRTVTRLTKDVLTLTWIAFAVALLTGVLMFISNAVNYAHNFYFQIKILLLVLAGINMLFFHFVVGRDVDSWGVSAQTTPLRARVAGGTSLLLWVGVVAFGRWIGFTLQPHLVGG